MYAEMCMQRCTCALSLRCSIQWAQHQPQSYDCKNANHWLKTVDPEQRAPCDDVRREHDRVGVSPKLRWRGPVTLWPVHQKAWSHFLLPGHTSGATIETAPPPKSRPKELYQTETNLAVTSRLPAAPSGAFRRRNNNNNK